VIKSAAFYDSLYIILRMQEVFGNVFRGELHLLAYLSCLMSLYRGQPVSCWDYFFMKTPNGAPYSPEIDAAIEDLLLNGWIATSGQHLCANERSVDFFHNISELGQNSIRNEFLDAACSSVSGLPIGMIKTAMSLEPELFSAIGATQGRILLDGPGVEILYEQFEALNHILGAGAELMVPAIVWLTYLSQKASEK
jgi:hypothetical protein